MPGNLDGLPGDIKAIERMEFGVEGSPGLRDDGMGWGVGVQVTGTVGSGGKMGTVVRTWRTRPRPSPAPQQP